MNLIRQLLRSGLSLPVLLMFGVLALSGCGGGGGGGGGGATTTYTIGGNVSGLVSGKTVVLQNNGGNDLTVSANGTFTFTTALANGAAYSVTVKTQPVGQTCSASNSSGTVNGANVTNIAVVCALPGAAVTLDAGAKLASAALTWNDTGASSYNLYYSTAPNCNIATYAACPGGTMVTGVTSPYTVTGLTNGQNYWFKVESVSAGGNATSNEAGARPDALAPNGAVRAIVHDAGGVAYLGGEFTQVGLRTGSGVPLSLTTGRVGAFPPIDGNGGVFVAVSDGAGGYYIGGSFASVGGQPRNNLAHIRADGTLGTWNPNANNYVKTLAVSGTTVYVGGAFTTIGGTARNRLAAIGADGTLGAWNPDADAAVNALVVSGSTVYAGGGFTTLAGGTVARHWLAAIDATTGVATAWDPNINNGATTVAGSVESLAVSGSIVYVGGGFFQAGTLNRSMLAGIDASTGVATSWNPDLNGAVKAIIVSGNTVYVGGGFTTLANYTVTRNYLAAIDATTGNATAWNPNADNSVSTLVMSGSTLYAGGLFTTLNGGALARSRLAAFDLGTGNATTWDPSAGNIVYALAVSGNTLYAGGSFVTINGTPRNRLAAFNTDGSLGTWNPDANAAVWTLAISGSNVYAGGDFTALGGVTRNRLAAIGTNGTLGTWNPNADNSVRVLALSGTTVYAGGDFTALGATARNRIAAIGTDGTLATWDPNADATVRALAISGSTVYAGGDFINIGGQARWRIAAIDTGGLATAWNPEANGTVNALAMSPDGTTVYAGGAFTRLLVTTSALVRNRLAAIDAATGSVTTWNPAADGAVNALTVTGSGTGAVYVGGFFTVFGSGAVTVRNRIAAFDTTTATPSIPTAWNPDLDSEVYAIALSGGSVYTGGIFTTTGGGASFSPYFAVLAP